MRNNAVVLSALVLVLSGCISGCISGCKGEAADAVNAAAPSAAGVEGAAPVAAEAAQTDPEARTDATAPRPELGGKLALVGDHHVELAVHETGDVRALVFDGEGKRVSEPESVGLVARLRAEGGAKPEVELRWDEKRDCFHGSTGAKARLVSEPASVSLTLGGKTATAELAEYALLEEPRFGGTVLGAGRYSAELVARPDGEVLAFVSDVNGASVDAAAHAKCRFSGKRQRELELSWDGPRACFSGKLDAGAKLEPGPVELTLVRDGKASVGGLARVALTPAAAHEGSVIVAGDFGVELVAAGDAVAVYVFDASGNAHTGGDIDVKLGVGAGSEVACRWDAPSASYRGKLSGKLDLAAQPMRIALSAGGRSHFGAAQSLKAVASLGAGAELAGDVKAGAAAGAKLDIEPPSVKAKAGASLAAGANAAAKAKADAAAAAKAKADAAVKAQAAAKVNVPKPAVKVSVNKEASSGDTAKTGTSTGLKAGAKAGISFGSQ
jgi:hypothetical protein